MIVDRYEPVNLFALIPTRYATLEPHLQELDRLLDDDAIFQRVKRDLTQRYPQSLTKGRHSTPVEVILRMLVVKRVYQWSYEATEHFVFDSLVLRQFCRIYWKDVPDDTTLNRWANLITPQTVERLRQAAPPRNSQPPWSNSPTGWMRFDRRSRDTLAAARASPWATKHASLSDPLAHSQLISRIVCATAMTAR